jgi:hypothetical protein
MVAHWPVSNGACSVTHVAFSTVCACAAAPSSASASSACRSTFGLYLLLACF